MPMVKDANNDYLTLFQYMAHFCEYNIIFENGFQIIYISP